MTASEIKTAPLEAGAVADLLEEIGRCITLQGGNRYRGRAYLQAADRLRALTMPLDRIVAEGALQEIPGIGEAIARVITEVYKTGTHPLLEEMRSDIPSGVLEMLRIPGLRPKQILTLFREEGIASLSALEEAARTGRLAALSRFGPAFQRKVLQGVETLNASAGRLHITRAAELLADAEQALRQTMPNLVDVMIAGDLRRGCELVADLSLVAVANDKPRTLEAAGILIRITDASRRGAALLTATGSARHLDQLRGVAAQKGFILDAEGLRRGRKIIAASEAAIYAALGLTFIPPELREGNDEIALAARGMLPELVTDSDVHGILHAHTTFSDGSHTLEVMADVVRARGYQYFGVSDHSQSAHYAGGMKASAITSQHREIDRLNATYGPGFRILKGIESDIRDDGSLDYPDEVLATFDFIIASVHSRFQLDEAAQTARIVRAIRNPYTTILGHMTGRQLLRRPGYAVDIEVVLKACAIHDVAVEINANPWRLDLDWRWHRRALELGCTVAINPDAHATGEIALVHWGVEIARKGGVPKERVLNCLDLRALTNRLAARRRRKRSC